MVAFFIVLPALVPICALLGFAASPRLWKTPLMFILACAAALVLAAAPRMDVAHLTYCSPLSFVVAGCVLANLLPGRFRAPLAMALGFGACLLLSNAVTLRLHSETAQTRAGVMVGGAQDLALERALETGVQKGEAFFTFPYMPVAYFLTQGANPDALLVLAARHDGGCR